jgi:catechol 2,3-dioxygenase-like lactoylglutathione lyase family enzyme
VTRPSALTNVFGFTEDREQIARFFEDVLGLHRQPKRDDSVWFEPEGGATFTVHDREDEPEGLGFVPWFHVADLAATFERARARDANVGEIRDGHFFVRDPDGRVFGVREWR